MQVRSLGWENAPEEEMTAPVFLPEKSHGQRSLVGCSPQGQKESDMAEHKTRPQEEMGGFECVCSGPELRHFSSRCFLVFLKSPALLFCVSFGARGWDWFARTIDRNLSGISRNIRDLWKILLALKYGKKMTESRSVNIKLNIYKG